MCLVRARYYITYVTSLSSSCCDVSAVVDVAVVVVAIVVVAAAAAVGVEPCPASGSILRVSLW